MELLRLDGAAWRLRAVVAVCAGVAAAASVEARVTRTDIQLGKDADGKVRYETSFTITKPVDMAMASGFLWHDVPNRGGNIIINVTERDLGDIGLSLIHISEPTETPEHLV